jgi:hypothetical protein
MQALNFESFIHKNIIMKKFTSLTMILIVIIYSEYVHAQTNTFPPSGAAGIGTTTPNPSAKLEIRSTGKGFLMPRMTEAQRNAIPSPAKGLLVYQNNGATGFYFYNGTAWKPLNAEVGANKSLSNISNVAINTSLSPGISGSLDLGGSQHNWKDLWLSGQVWCGGFGVLKVNYDPNHGKDNISIGGFSIQNDERTHNSIAIGIGALFNNSGNGNIGIGGIAMSQIFYGENNVGLGNGTNTNLDTISNGTALGANAIVSASNQVRVGTIETSSIGGFTGWTVISDNRFNKNIQHNIHGLDFINQLKPITYMLDVDAVKTALKNPNAKSLDKRIINTEPVADNTKTQTSIIYSGFSGQEVEAVAKKLNFQFTGIDAPKNARDLYGLRYDEFVVPLVKAVQELSAQNDELKKELEDLKSTVALIQSQVKSNTSEQISVNNLNAKLEQNIPNPFKQQTAIRYYIPQAANTAFIKIVNTKGETIKVVQIAAKGYGQFNFQTASLAAGNYSYSLFIDGKLIDTKKMLLAK